MTDGPFPEPVDPEPVGPEAFAGELLGQLAHMQDRVGEQQVMTVVGLALRVKQDHRAAMDRASIARCKELGLPEDDELSDVQAIDRVLSLVDLAVARLTARSAARRQGGP